MPDKPPITICTSPGSLTDKRSITKTDLTHDNQGSNNNASNGYWIHDDLGPKYYVAPPDANDMDVDEGDLIARISDLLRSEVSLDASRIQIALEKGVVIINGIAVSAAECQLVERAVQSVAGEVRVENRLVVDQTLQKVRDPK